MGKVTEHLINLAKNRIKTYFNVQYNYFKTIFNDNFKRILKKKTGLKIIYF